MLKEIFNNQWTVGIVGAIFSGIVLVPITYKMTQILEKKKIPEIIRKANAEIMVLLKKIITEEKELNLEIIESFRLSVARKHHLKVESLDTINMLIDDLVTDVYETSYISSDRKNEMAINLLNSKTSSRESVTRDYGLSLSEKLLYATVTIGAVSVGFAISATILKTLNDKASKQLIGENIPFSLVIIVGAILLITVYAITGSGSIEDKAHRIQKFFGLSNGEDEYK